MKRLFVFYFICMFATSTSLAQNSKQAYPEPEFLKEIYAFNKETNSLVRLEKEESKMETKVRFAGFGGGETGYNIEGEKSRVRFSSYKLPTFVFRSREDHSSSDNTMGGADSLSMMMGNDSAAKMMSGMSNMMDDFLDPSKTITLYAMDTKKGVRSIIMGGSSGAFSKKQKSSNKYAISFRKIKDGYYEIVVNKMLPKGEYSFMNSGMGSMDLTLFAFGVD